MVSSGRLLRPQSRLLTASPSTFQLARCTFGTYLVLNVNLAARATAGAPKTHQRTRFIHRRDPGAPPRAPTACASLGAASQSRLLRLRRS